MTALDILQRGVDSYAAHLQPSGELHDPLFGEPTQYGTAYHAYANAVLAQRGAEPSSAAEPYKDRAARGLLAALAHVLDADGTPNASGFDRVTGSISNHNHRDFFWPPVLKTFRILRDLGGCDIGQLADQIAKADIKRSFMSRPPSNWAVVWVSGEWLRIREGLSPYSVSDVDAWVVSFLDRTRLDLGFYEEPGHPNSYDLFTRYHLADILLEGYDGQCRPDLEQLMETGLRRSLDVQLSDGSLASAHRSTGQTWTVGAQIAYFTHATRFFAHQDPVLAGLATDAAGRALASFARWQRPVGPYSPVENQLPPAYRVGYERYSVDATYGNLALAFLAGGVACGLAEWLAESPIPKARTASVRVDYDPIHRVVAHGGAYSVHANAWPAPGYDAFGLIDLTFGTDRFFHFASTAHHVGTGDAFNLGLARREQPGRTAVTVLAQQDLALTEPIEMSTHPPGFTIEARPRGQHYCYRLRVRIEDDGVQVCEDTVGAESWPTLLVPYLRDPGTGTSTQVGMSTEHGEIRFRHGTETVLLAVEGAIEHVLDLPHGYENRRGLCGLLRIDLRDRAEGVRYQLRVES